MFRKQRGKIVACFVFAFMLVIGNSCICEAKSSKRVSITKTLNVFVGKKTTVKLKNNKKKVKWKVVKGKKIVKVIKTTKTSCKIKALKKGTATVQAKIANKKYTCTINVKNKEKMSDEKQTTENQDNKEENDKDNVNQADFFGDGWYISKGTLYLSKIYYSVWNITGNNYYIYERPWNDYIDKIINIEIDGDMVYRSSNEEMEKNLAENEPYYCDLFLNMEMLESVTIKRLNLGNVTDVSYMFAYNEKLSRVDLSGLDMSNVKEASHMFECDHSLKSIDLQSWNVSRLNSASGMFKECTSLHTVQVSSWNTCNIKDFSHMFDGCVSLTSINLSNWTIDDADVSAMFFDCKNLQSVNLLNVNLQNTIAINVMFNNNNSIDSYLFAQGWNIYENKDKTILPIIDDFYNEYVAVVPSEDGPKIITFVCYKKSMPSWYKESVEYILAVDEEEHVFSSMELDIYVYSGEGGAQELETSDCIDSIINAMNKMDIVDDTDSQLLSNIMEKMNLLKNWKKDKVSYKDLFDFVKMEVEEIEAIINE